MALCVLSGPEVLVYGTVCIFRVWSTCLWHCVHFQGLEYLLRGHLVEDSAEEIALFLHTARDIDWKQMRKFLVHR